MNPTFWSGKRVLMTGHTGFKGSWLALWLQTLGAQVTGYAMAPPTNPSLFNVADVAAGMESVVGDIRDLTHLQAVMNSASPEVVFHMAAQPLVRRSYQDPVETYSTNVMGTVNLLEAVRNCPNVRAVVNITTDKVYENREWLWGYRENEALGGHDPYSNSKGCAELVTAAYRSSFFAAPSASGKPVAVATARAGNVIGGGDWAQDRLIPDLLNAFDKGRQVDIRNPHAVRPWQHVLEPLRGYLLLAERLTEQGNPYAEAWNFGPHAEDARPVQWIVQRMAELWGPCATWKSDKGKHPHEAGNLKLDISKVQSRLGWQPSLRLDEALALIVEWYKQYQLGTDLRALTLQQIADYQTRTRT